MKYSDWKMLTNSEKQQVKLRHRPHVRIATIFSAVLLLVFFAFLFRILKNRTVHVVRKPTADEAFSTAKAFIKDRLKMPATADFDNHKQVTADTAHNLYYITSDVNTQNTSGKQVTIKWNITLNYTGGDWGDKSSWIVKEVKLDPTP